MPEVEATVGGVEVVVVDGVEVGRVEHSVEVGGKGKVAPLQRGIGRTGLAAVPTGNPWPGKVGKFDPAAEAALTAWCFAALTLSLACLAGPGTLL